MLFVPDLWYLVFIAPAVLLALLAQWWIRSAYASAQEAPTRWTGAQAARWILDKAGLIDVGIELTPGHLSDHYDPSEKVLRLSPEVYHNRDLAAVGIAAHEAGHAIQDAQGYLPLVVRNAAVPAAQFGSGIGMLLLIFGLLTSMTPLLIVGIVLFSGVVVFQLVNLPVEFDASSRAKLLLVDHKIVPEHQMSYVNSVLNAAALTYVAATLQAVLTLLYFAMRASGSSRHA